MGYRCTPSYFQCAGRIVVAANTVAPLGTVLFRVPPGQFIPGATLC